MTSGFARTADAATITLPRHVRDNGALVVAERATGIPFAIARMFTISAPRDSVRSQHAHRLCAQVILCASGAVDVTVDDGTTQRVVSLMRDNEALYVPAMIWTVLTFRAPQSILVVLSERPYEAEDYIADYAVFCGMRKAGW